MIAAKSKAGARLLRSAARAAGACRGVPLVWAAAGSSPLFCAPFYYTPAAAAFLLTLSLHFLCLEGSSPAAGPRPRKEAASSGRDARRLSAILTLLPHACLFRFPALLLGSFDASIASLGGICSAARAGEFGAVTPCIQHQQPRSSAYSSRLCHGVREESAGSHHEWSASFPTPLYSLPSLVEWQALAPPLPHVSCVYDPLLLLVLLNSQMERH